MTEPRPLPQRLLRPREAALALGISKAYVYRLLSEGTIRKVALGRAVRIPVEEIDRLVAQGLPLAHTNTGA